MKKFLILSLILLPAVSLLAQSLPVTYKLEDYSKTAKLAKTSDLTPTNNTIEYILTIGDTVLLATSDGVSKSTDNGNSWTTFSDFKPNSQDGISAIGYDHGTIWVGTWHSENKLGEDFPVGTGLSYSTDGGKNWVNLPQPVDDPGDSSIVYGINTLRALPVTVGVNNYVTKIAFTKNTVWITLFAGGLRKSTDMGKTWQRVVLPPDYLDSIKPSDTLHFALQPVAGKFGDENYLNHRAFSVTTVDDNTIYVGTAGGVNKSTDGGVSWRKFNHTNQTHPISGDFVLDLEYNAYDGSLWAATWKAEGQTEYYAASRTSDGGANWDVYLSGEKIHDFAFAPNTTQREFDVLAAAESGIYRSPDNGESWISTPPIYDSNTKIGLGITEFRSVRSTSHGPTSDIFCGSLNGLAKFSGPSGAWNGDWTLYIAAKTVENVNTSYVFPNPFSPSSETARILYATDKDADVTIRIFDFGMNLVRTIIQNAPRGKSARQLESWDGKDERGNIVPNGVYFYRIDIGDDKPLYGKIMVII